MRVNTKTIEFSPYEYSYDDVYEDDERSFIITEILEFADDSVEFDPEFVLSIKKTIEKKGFITANQYNGLVNIYNGFRIYEIKNK